MSLTHSGLIRNVLVNLSDIGVEANNIGFTTVTMSSEHFVCVRENKTSGKSNLKILDMRHGVEVSDKSITADSVIMNPNKTHLALRAENTIQIFNIDTKVKIASVQVDFDIVYWNWVDEITLVAISESSVYKWNYEESESTPERWFERNSALNDCQIINISCDCSKKWCSISGISLKEGRIAGSLQLYNDSKKLSQLIEGHASAFFTLKPSSYPQYSNSIFAFASRNGKHEMKVQLIEIDQADTCPSFQKRVVDLSLDKMSDNDFPISVQFDSKLQLVIVYTKFGLVYVIEPHYGACIVNENCSESPIFLVTSSTYKNQHFYINRKGELVNCQLDLPKLFSHCLSHGPDFYLTAGKIADNVSLEEQQKLYLNEFDSLKNSGKHLEALLLVAKSSKTFLRTFEYLSSIKDFPQVNGTSAILEYFAMILNEEEGLNEVESLELAQLTIKKEKLEILKKWMFEDKIFCTVQLGKLVLDYGDILLALEVFKRSNSQEMIGTCLAILGQFEELESLLLSATNNPIAIDIKFILKYLLKSKIEFIPGFLTILFKYYGSELEPEYFDEILNNNNCSEALNSDALDSILVNFADSFVAIASEELVLIYVQRLIKNHPEHIVKFFTNVSIQNASKIKSETILPLLKDACLNEAAFILENDIDEAIALVKNIKDLTFEFNVLRLSPQDTKTLISEFLSKDSSKYGSFCIKLSELTEMEDFEEIKDMFQGYASQETVCDFLTLWSAKIQSDRIGEELFISAIKLRDESRILDLCNKLDFSDPIKTFSLLQDFDYKSNALKIFAIRYQLHKEIFSMYFDNEDQISAGEYTQLLGQDEFWRILPSLLESESEIDINFLKKLLKLPKSLETVVSVAKQLEESNELPILNSVLEDETIYDSSEEILTIRAKILSYQDESLFLNFIDQHTKIQMESVLNFCESHNLALALTYYIRKRQTNDVIRISDKMKQWNKLVSFLIELKDLESWSKVITSSNWDLIMPLVLESASHFPDSESASCLIKSLTALNKLDDLCNLISKLLKHNNVLKSNRSLQTLYLLNLIKSNQEQALSKCLELEAYDQDIIIPAAIDSGNLALVLAVLKRFEMWNYALKITLYGMKDIEEATEIALKCDHPEAWHALAEYHLFCGDSLKAYEYSEKSGFFRRFKELIVLLRLEKQYEFLYNFLVKLQKTEHFEVVFEREMMYCLLKLNRRKDVMELIKAANPTMLVEFARLLSSEGLYELAGECFQRSGFHDKAAFMYVKIDDINSTVENAIKSLNSDIWLATIQLALNKNAFDVAKKFSLKIFSLNDSKKHEVLCEIYFSLGAYEQLIEVIEIYLDSSAPHVQLVLLLGKVLCERIVDKLEGFITKYYSILPKSFVTTLIEYKLWKEAFKFLLMHSELDEALELVIAHPSIEFDHRKLSSVLGKVRNGRILEKLLIYYMEYSPQTFLDLLGELQEFLDISTIIKVCKEYDVLFILEGVLKRQQATAVNVNQKQNSNSSTLVTVSMALNDLLLESNDYYGLIESIKRCPAIDSNLISKKLLSSKHRHFKVLAAKLIANSGSYSEALSVLVQEDALIETLMILSQSGNVQYAEALLSRYARSGNSVMYLVTGYVLFDLLRLDVVLEWSQRCQFQEITRGLLCQGLKNKLK